MSRSKKDKDYEEEYETEPKQHKPKASNTLDTRKTKAHSSSKRKPGVLI
jgi:hypothetical protein